MSRGRFIALSVFLDTFLVLMGYVLALGAWLTIQGESLPERNFAALIALLPFIMFFYVAAAWTYGLYDPERSDTAWSVVASTGAAAFLGTILTLALAFLGGDLTRAMPRPVPLIAGVIIAVLLVTWRLLFLHFGRITWPEQCVVIVGVGLTAIELAEELNRRKQWGWRVAGLLDPSTHSDCESPESVHGFEVLGCATDAAQIARETGADRIIVVSPIALRELVESLVLADELNVRVDVVPELYEIFIGSVDALIGDIPLMRITGSTVAAYYATAKRAIDIVVALVLLVLVSPLLLLAAVGILLTDGFPVLFRQERVGKDLKPFQVYKLRSMVKDAEKLSGPVLAEEDDPRITRVGRFLRKTRIDELPQLLNILKGDMSFVGPRPERAFFVEQYLRDIPGYRERFGIKPGVTGLAQVSGGYATTAERKLKYDLIYLFHQNLAMDVQIIVETLKVVLTGRGAR